MNTRRILEQKKNKNKDWCFVLFFWSIKCHFKSDTEGKMVTFSTSTLKLNSNRRLSFFFFFHPHKRVWFGIKRRTSLQLLSIPPRHIARGRSKQACLGSDHQGLNLTAPIWFRGAACVPALMYSETVGPAWPFHMQPGSTGRQGQRQTDSCKIHTAGPCHHTYLS